MVTCHGEPFLLPLVLCGDSAVWERAGECSRTCLLLEGTRTGLHLAATQTVGGWAGKACRSERPAVCASYVKRALGRQAGCAVAREGFGGAPVRGGIPCSDSTSRCCEKLRINSRKL